MKEEKTKKSKIVYALIFTISVCLLVAAVVLTVYFASGAGQDNVIQTPPKQETPAGPSVPDDEPTTVPSQPTGGEAVRFTNPLSYESVSSFNEVYHNQTTGWYYRHKAVDFAAQAGSSVAAIADGTIECISLNETTGNYVIIDHGDGLKSLYRFVDVNGAIKAGQSIKKGQSFATVSEACGSEYKDGAHLHLEITQNGVSVDPAAYLDIDYAEK